jgi:hypothetical protein
LTRDLLMAVLCAYLPQLDSVLGMCVAIIRDYWPRLFTELRARSPSVRRLQVGVYTLGDPLLPGGSLLQRCTHSTVANSTWRRFGVAMRLLAGSSRLPCSSATPQDHYAGFDCLPAGMRYTDQHGVWIYCD